MTALIKKESSNGSRIKNPENQMNMFRKSKLVSGICVTLAILCSGCATSVGKSKQMSYQSINTFQTDCSKKNEQITMLNSMRTTRDDRALAKLKNIFQPWLQFTDSSQYADNYYQGSGRTDAYIDYMIQDLINFCRGRNS
jgi:hypothetical protein